MQFSASALLVAFFSAVAFAAPVPAPAPQVVDLGNVGNLGNFANNNNNNFANNINDFANNNGDFANNNINGNFANNIGNLDNINNNNNNNNNGGNVVLNQAQIDALDAIGTGTVVAPGQAAIAQGVNAQLLGAQSGANDQDAQLAALAAQISAVNTNFGVANQAAQQSLFDSLSKE